MKSPPTAPPSPPRHSGAPPGASHQGELCDPQRCSVCPRVLLRKGCWPGRCPGETRKLEVKPSPSPPPCGLSLPACTVRMITGCLPGIQVRKRTEHQRCVGTAWAQRCAVRARGQGCCDASSGGPAPVPTEGGVSSLSTGAGPSTLGRGASGREVKARPRAEQACRGQALWQCLRAAFRNERLLSPGPGAGV